MPVVLCGDFNSLAEKRLPDGFDPQVRGVHRGCACGECACAGEHKESTMQDCVCNAMRRLRYYGIFHRIPCTDLPSRVIILTLISCYSNLPNLRRVLIRAGGLLGRWLTC